MRNQVQLNNSRLGQGLTDFQQPTISKGSQQDQQSSFTENQNEVTDRITKPCEKDSEIGNMLY